MAASFFPFGPPRLEGFSERMWELLFSACFAQKRSLSTEHSTDGLGKVTEIHTQLWEPCLLLPKAGQLETDRL